MYWFWVQGAVFCPAPALGLQGDGKNRFQNQGKFIYTSQTSKFVHISQMFWFVFCITAMYPVHTSNSWKVAINTIIWDGYILAITCIEFVPGWVIIIYPKIYIDSKTWRQSFFLSFSENLYVPPSLTSGHSWTDFCNRFILWHTKEICEYSHSGVKFLLKWLKTIWTQVSNYFHLTKWDKSFRKPQWSLYVF